MSEISQAFYQMLHADVLAGPAAGGLPALAPSQHAHVPLMCQVLKAQLLCCFHAALHAYNSGSSASLSEPHFAAARRRLQLTKDLAGKFYGHCTDAAAAGA